MKKLVSAATSLVMAATMVGAVAPVVAGAADAKKGLSLLAYKDTTLSEGVKADGSTVTVSADAVKAGDVTVPVGLYLTEETADLVTIGCGITVNGTDAKNIKFSNIYQPGKTKFFDAEKTFKSAGGDEVSSDTVVSFAGKYSKRTGYTAIGTYQITPSESEPLYGVDNSYIGFTWNCGGTKYEWFGAKSDEYPVLVFDVTLPKGTAEGEYTIDFVEAKTKFDNPLCLLESSVKYDAMERKNLDLNSLTIKVGDAEAPKTTTTSPAQTTTTQTTASSGADSSTTTTTTKTDDTPIENADVVLDLINPDSEDGYWRVDPDDGVVYVDMHIATKDEKVKPTSLVVELAVEGGFTVEFESISPALDKSQVVKSDEKLAATVMCPQTDGHGTVVSPDENVALMMTLNVPDGIKDGLYEIKITKAFINKDSKLNAGETYSAAVKNGYIAIGNVDTPKTTTTDTTAATTTKTTTTATTTNKTSGSSTAATTTKATTGSSTTNTPGTPLYGDTNCDNVVRINDVVLLNKYLNDNKSYAITDQGKLNADCYNPKGGKELTADDSDAIIKSIVHLVELPVKK